MVQILNKMHIYGTFQIPHFRNMVLLRNQVLCLNWENVTHSPARSIFVGSKTAIDNPLLLTTVPMVQPVYTE
jgi:hypothetical protein